MDPLHLRSAGTSLLISFDSGGGRSHPLGRGSRRGAPDLRLPGRTDPALRRRCRVPAGLLPQASSAWRGRPGFARAEHRRRGSRAATFRPALRASRADGNAEGRSVALDRCTADPDAGISVTHALRFTTAASWSCATPSSMMARPRSSSTSWPPSSRWRRTPSNSWTSPAAGAGNGTRSGAASSRAPGCDGPPRPHGARFLPDFRRGHAGLRQSPREGLGDAPRLERQPRTVRSTPSPTAAP